MQVFYEFPLNERIRIFMRLEQLFVQCQYFLGQPSIHDSRAAVNCLLDIISIFSRNDLKSEILKEIERHTNVLGRAQSMDAGLAAKSAEIIEELSSLSAELYQTRGKIGLSLMEDELFKSIAQRNSIPGGSYVFDLPAYHYWLEQSAETRLEALYAWVRPLEQIRKAINLLMSSIRDRAITTEESAQSGFFQKNLDHAQSYQLLRIGLASDVPLFVEISGGKHRFTLRFMVAGGEQIVRNVQTDQDVSFQLQSCLI